MGIKYRFNLVQAHSTEAIQAALAKELPVTRVDFAFAPSQVSFIATFSSNISWKDLFRALKNADIKVREQRRSPPLGLAISKIE